jgi:putative sterol carrier protein
MTSTDRAERGLAAQSPPMKDLDLDPEGDPNGGATPATRSPPPGGNHRKSCTRWSAARTWAGDARMRRPGRKYAQPQQVVPRKRGGECRFKENEVYSTSKLFEDLMDEELSPKFRRADTIVQYRYTNPDSQITVKMKDGEEGQVDFGPTEMQPEIVMSMEADTAHRFWLGKVNVTMALAKGHMKAKGPVAKILKLVPLVKPVFPKYQAMLEKDNRDDLLKAA